MALCRMRVQWISVAAGSAQWEASLKLELSLSNRRAQTALLVVSLQLVAGDQLDATDRLLSQGRVISDVS